MGRTTRSSSNMHNGGNSACEAHLKLVTARKAGGPSVTKKRCEVSERCIVKKGERAGDGGGAIRCMRSNSRRSTQKRSTGRKRCASKKATMATVADDGKEEDEDEDEQQDVVEDDVDDDDDDDDVDDGGGDEGNYDCIDLEEKANREMVEFYDLLKKTAKEDVKRIDVQLRKTTSSDIAPPKGLETKAAEKVWEMAKTLTVVGDKSVKVGKNLQYFAASQSPWGQCVLAADIAGELLRERLDKVKAEEDAQCGRPRRKTARRQSVQPQQEGASYIGQRLALLVEDDGRFVTKVTGHDLKLKTFFNRELKQAYLDLTVQIMASNLMAQRSGEVAFEFDGEVKTDAVTTDDSLARYGVAMESARELYPLVVKGGKLSGCRMPSYFCFRKWVKMFLSVYKEFFMEGEVVYEKMVEEDYTRFYVLKMENGYGYEIRGRYQRFTRERQYEYWGDQLFPLKKMKDLRSRVTQSKKTRANLEREKAKQQSLRTTAVKEKGRKREQGRKSPPKSASKDAAAAGASSCSGGKKRSSSETGSAQKALPDTRKAKKKRKLDEEKGGGNRNRSDRSGTGGRRSNTKAETRSAETVPGRGGRRVASANNAAETEAKEVLDLDAVETVAVEVPDPLQQRNRQFDYVLLPEAPLDGYLSTVMMKEGQKPREETMLEEVQHDDARDNVDKYVSVATGSESQYIDFCSLTIFLHGKQSQQERDFCRNEAEKRGLATLSIPGGSSYLSKEVNVLYPATPEYQKLIGDFKWDIGSSVQGMSQLVESKEYTAETVKGPMIGRGNLQFTFGMSDRNFNKAKPAESGQIASLDMQNERQLHKYFPDRGHAMGLALQKLAEVRDALARDRDGCEYNDEVRNQVFSGRVGEMFGLPTVGFENATLALTGHSRTLDAMVEKLLSKLSSNDRNAVKARYDGTSVETVDHEDQKNPKEPEYSRVVLGKWRIRLLADRDDDYLVVTLIGNHRASVGTYQAKTKGIKGLSNWIREKFEARAEETGHIDYGADGDFLASGGAVLRVGFLPNETNGLDKKTTDKHGYGCFVSYSRPMSSSGGWRRHRKTILQPVVRKEAEKLGRKRKREDALDDEDDPKQLDGEMKALRKRSTIHGELIMKRADFNRCADLSGCISAAEQMRDHFVLDQNQARQLALCIFWHAKSRAIFLLKSQALLDGNGDWADEFEREVKEEQEQGKAGAAGSYFMNMVDSNRMGRMASELIRSMQLNVNWNDDEDGFTPEFVADQSEKLRLFLIKVEQLKSTSTTDFLIKNLGLFRHVHKFVLPQVIPVCYFLGLVNCHSKRAAEAPILDKTKAHYVKFIEQGVDPKFFDLSVLVVALQFKTTPLTIENTGCEVERTQANVHDFMLAGQMFYDLRPVPGCNYINAKFEVWVKKWGPDEVWVRAVKEHSSGRFRHPSDLETN